MGSCFSTTSCSSGACCSGRSILHAEGRLLVPGETLPLLCGLQIELQLNAVDEGTGNNSDGEAVVIRLLSTESRLDIPQQSYCEDACVSRTVQLVCGAQVETVQVMNTWQALRTCAVRFSVARSSRVVDLALAALGGTVDQRDQHSPTILQVAAILFGTNVPLYDDLIQLICCYCLPSSEEAALCLRNPFHPFKREGRLQYGILHSVVCPGVRYRDLVELSLQFVRQTLAIKATGASSQRGLYVTSRIAECCLEYTLVHTTCRLSGVLVEDEWLRIARVEAVKLEVPDDAKELRVDFAVEFPPSSQRRGALPKGAWISGTYEILNDAVKAADISNMFIAVCLRTQNVKVGIVRPDHKNRLKYVFAGASMVAS